MHIDFSCPIELLQVSFNNGTCSFLLNNLNDTMLIGVDVELSYTTPSGETLSQVEHFLNLGVFQGEPKTLSFAVESVPVEFSLEPTFAKFENGSIWSSGKMNSFYYNLEPANGNELLALKREVGEDAIAFPTVQGDVWVCVCGRANREDEATCRRCKRTKDYVFNVATKENIENSAKRRKQKMDDENKKEVQTAQNIKKAQQTNAQKKKHRKKRLMIALGITSATLIVGSIAYVTLWPHYRSFEANKLIQQGLYTEAINVLNTLPQKFNPQERTQKAHFYSALALIEKGDEESLLQAKAMLNELENVDNAQEKLQEVNYKLGEIYLAQKKYDEAIQAFTSVLAYNDSAFKLKQAQYQKAMLAFNAKSWLEAEKAFSALGNYSDAPDKLVIINYNLGKENLQNHNLEKAVFYLEPIQDYEDAKSYLMEAYYQQANQLYQEKHFEKAGELYIIVSNAKNASTKYPDAQTKGHVLLYTEGKKHFEEGNYTQAKNNFEFILDYLDSWSFYKKSTFALVEQALENNDLKTATSILEEFSGDDEANALRQKVNYKHAEELLEEGKIEEAKEIFSQLVGYLDSAERYSELLYKQAEELLNQGKFDEASQAFESLGIYADSQTRQKDALYAKAQKAFEQKDFEQAASLFTSLNGFNDSTQKAEESIYAQVDTYLQQHENEKAEALLQTLKAEQAEDMLQELRFNMAKDALNHKNYQKAYDYFQKAGDYKDAEQQKENAQYLYAESLENEGKILQAAWLFMNLGDQKDAKQRANRLFDTYFDNLSKQVETAKKEQNNQKVFDLLKDVDMAKIPERFLHIKEAFEQATYQLGNQAFEQKNAALAHQYYALIPHFENVSEKLNDPTYKMIGTWATETGQTASFNQDGSATVLGEHYAYYFVDRYTLLLGNDLSHLEPLYAISKRSIYGFTLKEKQNPEHKKFVFTPQKESAEPTPSIEVQAPLPIVLP